MPAKAALQISVLIVPCQLRDVFLRGVLGELWGVVTEERPEVDRHLFGGTRGLVTELLQMGK